MIRSLFRILDVADRRRLRTFVAAVVVYGVLQGLGILLVVPVLRSLLEGDTDRAAAWLGALAAVTALTCGVFWVQGMLGLNIALALLRGLHHRVGDHLGTLPIGWFSADRIGRLTHSLSQGTSMLTAVPAYLLQPLVTAVVTPITTALGIWLFDWRLALVIFLMGPVLLLVYRWAAGLAERSAHQVDAASVESASRVVEFARTQPVLRAFGRTTDGHHLLDDASVGQREIGRSAFKTGVPGLAAFATAVQAAFVLVMVLGVWLALDGSIDAPELVVLLVLATRFTGPLIEAADLGASLRLAKHDLERIEEVLSVPPQSEGSTALSDAPAEVSFENVSFAYDDRDVLHDVSFTVPPGTMTALVGPSGGGKSTVAHLIMRFMDVGDGVCRVGGVDVRDVPLTELMSMVSMVFQEVYLFDDSIEANIRVGRPGATDEELNHVVRLARVDEIAARLPDGLATRVGEGGASLSGGERQRVSIARALLKDAPIVLLDEATASLDPENEAAVGSALEALTVDRTLIVIAHRLSTIEHADQIVVLDQGHVVQRGTHAELRGVPGRYADFWAERDRARGWRLNAAVPVGAR